MHPHGSAASDPNSIMTALRTTTASLHAEAEGGAVQQAMVRGELPLSDYTAYLTQMLHVHRILEAALRRVRPHVPQILAVVDDEQFQEDNLLADLDTFGAFEDETPALPAVLRYRRSVCWLESHRPLTLLGQHYVLEGSKNGAKFIAKAVRAAYALTPGVGDRFLDPYGDRQRVKWMQFKAAMDAATFTEAERGDVLTGAQEMFHTVIGLAADLSAAELATCPA